MQEIFIIVFRVLSIMQVITLRTQFFRRGRSLDSLNKKRQFRRGQLASLLINFHFLRTTPYPRKNRQHLFLLQIRPQTFQKSRQIRPHSEKRRIPRYRRRHPHGMFLIRFCSPYSVTQSLPHSFTRIF